MTLAEHWHRLDAELGAWQAAGLTARFWWRDDDAVDATPALDRLLALRQQAGIPLTLAVVPDGATPALAERLAREPAVFAAQHGFSHRNHAPPGAKKSEFPPERPPQDSLASLAAGRDRLTALLGARHIPLLVPPWNRFADALLPALPGLGFAGISTFRIAAPGEAAAGLVRLNTHLDPVDWHGQNGPEGAIRACLDTALELLAGLRMGRLPPQPLGLLSHHLRHDGAGWDFLTAFLARTTAQPAVRWIAPGDVLDIGKPPLIVMPRS